jgi:hypothetical protein
MHVIKITPSISNHNFRFVLSQISLILIKFKKSVNIYNNNLVSLLLIHLFGIINAIIFLYKLGTN